nr:hypothetical protein [uncultured Dyadobacter sp.]
MTIIFWIAISLEFAGLLYFIRKAWMLIRQDQKYIYPEKYRQVFYPIMVLSLLIAVSFVAKYYLQSTKSAAFVAMLPVVALVLALVGVIVGTICVGGKWR